MSLFRFLHAADIHLDSPLNRLDTGDDRLNSLFRSGCRKAFDNLVHLAQQENVAFVLLAGDLYDGAWQDYNTGLFFIERMHRLRRAGIQVLLVSGNHDADSKITATLRLPDNVVHFSSHQPQTHRIDELRVAIHGQSYRHAATSENLARHYPPALPGLLNIGLLHTGLSGRPGHAPYAPCSLDDLMRTGYAYWALGHIHQREIVHEDPWVVFAGNIQGRHIRECGARGAFLVTVENGRIRDVCFQELDVARWHLLELDCSGLAKEEELTEKLYDQLRHIGRQANGRAVMIRLVLKGFTTLHPDLLARQSFWEENLRAVSLDCGDVRLEKILLQTRLPRDPGQRPDLDPLLADILDQAVEDPATLFADPLLQDLARKLPADPDQTWHLLPDTPEKQRQYIAALREMIRSKLFLQERK